jgi:hypothetical protein
VPKLEVHGADKDANRVPAADEVKPGTTVSLGTKGTVPGRNVAWAPGMVKLTTATNINVVKTLLI